MRRASVCQLCCVLRCVPQSACYAACVCLPAALRATVCQLRCVPQSACWAACCSLPAVRRAAVCQLRCLPQSAGYAVYVRLPDTLRAAICKLRCVRRAFSRAACLQSASYAALPQTVCYAACGSPRATLRAWLSSVGRLSCASLRSYRAARLCLPAELPVSVCLLSLASLASYALGLVSGVDRVSASQVSGWGGTYSRAVR